jgi:hypothetical protein
MSADDLEGDDIWGDGESKQGDAAADPDIEDDETRHMTIGELRQRIHLINNDIRIMKSDVQRIMHESRGQRDRIRDNQEKVKLNKQLPYLVANVVEILEPDAEDGESWKSLKKLEIIRMQDALFAVLCLIVSLLPAFSNFKKKHLASSMVLLDFRPGRRRKRVRRCHRHGCQPQDPIGRGPHVDASNNLSAHSRSD